jgi:hypothetical protein
MSGSVDDWDDDADDEEDPYESFDCHMDRQGFCGKAGSEECDFECPYRDLERG